MHLTAALGSSGRRPHPAQAERTARRSKCRKVKDVIFEISQDPDKRLCATCLKENVSTHAETWGKLRANIRQSLRGISVERYQPNRITLHIVRDEMVVLS